MVHGSIDHIDYVGYIVYMIYDGSDIHNFEEINNQEQ